MQSTNFNWPVCSHKPILRYLEKVVLNRNITNAYLFSGPSSVGKFHTALIFAKAILCQENKASPQAKNIPCGKCNSCVQFQKDIHPDLFVIQKDKAKKNIPIESVKVLQRNLASTSLLSSLTIGLIDDADTLSLEAANALLKTIEEPPPHTLILLVAHSQTRLPKTIVSRCSQIHFNLASKKDILEFLMSSNIDQKTAKVISHISDGRPGKARRYLADPELLKEFERVQDSYIRLIISNPLSRIKLIKSILPNTRNRQDNLKQVLSMIEVWQLTLRNIIYLKLGIGLPDYLAQKKELYSLSKALTQKQLSKALFCLTELRNSLQENVNIKARLEYYLLTI